MQTHNLKTWPKYFQEIWDGKKKFEVRKNDRNFKVGDKLYLKEWDPGKEVYLSRMLICKVPYILNGGAFGIDNNTVIMSIELESKEQIQIAN